MRTITLSDIDVQIIVDALRFRHGALVSQLLIPEGPQTPPQTFDPPPKYGVKKDGTPRKPPGRPRKKEK